MEFTEAKRAICVVAITDYPLTKTEAVSKNSKLVEQRLAPSLPTKSSPQTLQEAAWCLTQLLPPESHQIGYSNTFMHEVNFKSLKGTADTTRPLIKAANTSSGKDHVGQAIAWQTQTYWLEAREGASEKHGLLLNKEESYQKCDFCERFWGGPKESRNQFDIGCCFWGKIRKNGD